MKKIKPYNGFTGDEARVAKKAERYSGKQVVNRAEEFLFSYLSFWGFMEGYRFAMKDLKKREGK